MKKEDNHKQETLRERKSLVKDGFIATVTSLLFYTAYKIFTNDSNASTLSTESLPKPHLK